MTMKSQGPFFMNKIFLCLISILGIIAAMAENNYTSKIICTRTLLKKDVVDEVLEPIFHLERKRNAIKPEDVLVDVIALSRSCCAHPIEGFLAYATKENFLGRVVNGYVPSAARVCLLTQKVAMQLCSVQ